MLNFHRKLFSSKASLVARVENIFQNLPSTPLQELQGNLLDLANQGLRAPVKDLSDYLVQKLDDKKSLVSTLQVLGKLQIYNQDLFERLVAQPTELSNDDLVTLIYEAGRHGLRAKHFLSPLLAEYEKRVAISNEGENRKVKTTDFQVSRVYVGISKYAKEFSKFIERTSSIAISQAKNFYDFAVLFKIAKELRVSQRQFALAVSQKFLNTSWDEVHLGGEQKFNDILLLLSSCEKYGDTPQVLFEVVKKSAEIVARAPAEEFQKCDLVALIDSFYTIGSWRLLDRKHLTPMLSRFIADKNAIKYSTNVGLWVLISKPLMGLPLELRNEEMVQKWIQEILNLSKDRFMLDRITPDQKLTVLNVLLDYAVYDQEVLTYYTKFLVDTKSEVDLPTAKIAEIVCKLYQIDHPLQIRQGRSQALQLCLKKLRAPSAEAALNLLHSLALQYIDDQKTELDRALMAKLLSALKPRNEDFRQKIVTAFFCNGKERLEIIKFDQQPENMTLSEKKLYDHIRK